ncbi:MAG TPA: hypothetical protein ENJ27_00885 [Candidatus Moranbacteria bacterium]|nr:hypothetical protein [Candidatus Moranbacteria bacterium]
MDGKNIVSYGSVVFTRAEISFCNIDENKKETNICIHGTCSGREMSPIRINMILEEQHRRCSFCKKEIFWFLPEAKTEIINYLPASNELVVRVEIICECGTTSSFIVFLSLEKK